MPTDTKTLQKLLSKDLMDFLIRAGLVLLLVIMCLQIVTPFLQLLLWGLILAVALYPLHLRITKRCRGRQGLAATLLVLAGLIIIGTPTIMLGESFASRMQQVHSAFENNTISIPKPASSVADWPLIGDRVYRSWTAASEDLPSFVKDHREQLKDIFKGALAATAQTAGSVLLFLGALIVAGIIVAFGEGGSQVVLRILNRVTDPQSGARVQNLSVATIRSVATGVLGVAFIQALLLGVGFVVAGVPGAGVLAFLTLLIGIVQLPALIISLPVIAYIWWSGDASITINILLSVYLLVAGLADNFLKPLLLGRGVDVPMPVILLGALGGMVWTGIIGLFVGAVVLAVGYRVFMVWVDNVEPDADAEAEFTENTDGPSPLGE